MEKETAFVHQQPSDQYITGNDVILNQLYEFYERLRVITPLTLTQNAITESDRRITLKKLFLKLILFQVFQTKQIILQFAFRQVKSRCRTF